MSLSRAFYKHKKGSRKLPISSIDKAEEIDIGAHTNVSDNKMEMKMKKNILILLFAGLFQGVQAMGRARDFARQVFQSKAAILIAAATASKYGSYEIGKRDLKEFLESNPESGLSLEGEIRARSIFENGGYYDLVLVKDDRVCVAKIGDIIGLHLDEQARRLLQESKMFFCKKTAEDLVFFVLDKEHAKMALRHEFFHVVHNDSVTKKTIDCSLEPVALLAGKTAHVASRSKGIGLAVGALSYAVGTLGYYWYARQCEFAADKAAATDKESALRLSQILYNLDSSDRDFFKTLISTHPTTADRIKALEKQYGPLDISYVAPQDREFATIELVKFFSKQSRP